MFQKSCVKYIKWPVNLMFSLDDTFADIAMFDFGIWDF